MLRQIMCGILRQIICGATEIMLKGIAESKEVIIPRTGHMFRFSHPGMYSKQIREFLERPISSWAQLAV